METVFLENQNFIHEVKKLTLLDKKPFLVYYKKETSKLFLYKKGVNTFF